MATNKIKKEEVNALGELVEQVLADASFNDTDKHEHEELDRLTSLLEKLEKSVAE